MLRFARVNMDVINSAVHSENDPIAGVSMNSVAHISISNCISFMRLFDEGADENLSLHLVTNVTKYFIASVGYV